LDDFLIQIMDEKSFIWMDENDARLWIKGGPL
jgi:hypothetical protein